MDNKIRRTGYSIPFAAVDFDLAARRRHPCKLKSGLADGGMLRPFDISPTDGRFLFPNLALSTGSDQMTIWVMLNWAAAL